MEDWIHSIKPINCIHCGHLVDERDCQPSEDGEGSTCPECTPKMNADEFFTWCQELYETAGNARQLDEDFINLVYHKLKYCLPKLDEIV